jgi:hypothetical protein
MNSALEIHDSNLAGIELAGRDAVRHVHAAYIHRSEGRPGIDAGSGWAQDIDLTIFEAVVESLPSGFPRALAGGTLSVGQAAWDNLIPLPLAVSGVVSLSMDGAEVLYHEYGAQLRLTHEGDFVLDVLCGTIAQYGVEIVLTPEQIARYRRDDGEIFIHNLGEDVYHDPQIFKMTSGRRF